MGSFLFGEDEEGGKLLRGLCRARLEYLEGENFSLMVLPYELVGFQASSSKAVRE